MGKLMCLKTGNKVSPGPKSCTVAESFAQVKIQVRFLHNNKVSAKPARVATLFDSWGQSWLMTSCDISTTVSLLTQASAIWSSAALAYRYFWIGWRTTTFLTLSRIPAGHDVLKLENDFSLRKDAKQLGMRSPRGCHGVSKWIARVLRGAGIPIWFRWIRIWLAPRSLCIQSDLIATLVSFDEIGLHLLHSVATLF